MCLAKGQIAVVLYYPVSAFERCALLWRMLRENRKTPSISVKAKVHLHCVIAAQLPQLKLHNCSEKSSSRSACVGVHFPCAYCRGCFTLFKGMHRHAVSPCMLFLLCHTARMQNSIACCGQFVRNLSTFLFFFRIYYSKLRCKKKVGELEKPKHGQRYIKTNKF